MVRLDMYRRCHSGATARLGGISRGMMTPPPPPHAEQSTSLVGGAGSNPI